MLRQYAKYSIIVIIQLTVLAIIILLIVPIMLNHANSLNHGHEFFTRFNQLFFIGHGFFYTALYFLWPPIIRFLANRQTEPPTPKQISKAMHARCYLISAFLLFELLNLLR